MIIIGAGPAGYTAALYTARYKLDTLLIGKIPGGLMSEAPKVCNFPSYQDISGEELTKKMEEHVKSQGVELVYSRVEEITGEDLDFTVRTAQEEYQAKKVIIATGQERRKLGLEKERKFRGRGVSYCATCDAPFYEGKRVGVVGGGDAALASALLLAEHAAQVYILYRRDEFFRPEPIRIDKIKEKKKIEPVFNVNVEKLIGDATLKKVKLDNGDTLDLDGLFIEIGSIPNSDLAKEIGVKTTEHGYIITDEKRRTNIPGIYAAGDVIEFPLKQIITAASQGAEAGTTVYEELQKEKKL